MFWGILQDDRADNHRTGEKHSTEVAKSQVLYRERSKIGVELLLAGLNGGAYEGNRRARPSGPMSQAVSDESLQGSLIPHANSGYGTPGTTREVNGFRG